MKRSIITAFTTLIILVTILSCNKINPPFTREVTSGVSRGRNVLLEEFTGHKCPNCPAASVIAHDLLAIYPEVIQISIHAGTFANPSSAGLFTYDFRTAVGDELNSTYNVLAYPSGMVNRKATENGLVINKDQWEPAIQSFQDNDPVASMGLSNTYDTTSRKVTATIKTEFLENYLNPLNIVVYITEDSIVKPQINNDIQVGPVPTIEFYTHRHVLRGSFNGTWGTTLSSAAVTYGTKKTSTFTATLDTNWNDKQCYMVAFITDLSSHEVMQVVEKKIR